MAFLTASQQFYFMEALKFRGPNKEEIQQPVDNDGNIIENPKIVLQTRMAVDGPILVLKMSWSFKEEYITVREKHLEELETDSLELICKSGYPGRVSESIIEDLFQKYLLKQVREFWPTFSIF